MDDGRGIVQGEAARAAGVGLTVVRQARIEV